MEQQSTEIAALKHNRFKDASWFPTEVTEVLIGGAGGIGSWLALCLTRANFLPYVFDFDLYEEHNMAGQWCRYADTGIAKVVALKDNIFNFTGDHIEIENGKYTQDSMTHKFMFSAFDNMEARKIMFSKWESIHGEDPTAIFIDGRLLMEQLQIFCVRGGDKLHIAEYKDQHLFNDSEVADAVCTAKQTSHSAMMIASHMTGFFTNHYSNVLADSDDRSVPFYWEYLIPIDLLTQE